MSLLAAVIISIAWGVLAVSYLSLGLTVQCLICVAAAQPWIVSVLRQKT